MYVESGGETPTCWTTWPVLSCTDSIWWIWSKRKLTCTLNIPMVGSDVFLLKLVPFFGEQMFVFRGVLYKFLTSYVSHSLTLPDGALHWQIKFCNWRWWSPLDVVGAVSPHDLTSTDVSSHHEDAIFCNHNIGHTVNSSSQFKSSTSLFIECNHHPGWHNFGGNF